MAKESVKDEVSTMTETQEVPGTQETPETQKITKSASKTKTKKMVKIFIPKKDKDDKDQFFGINGKSYKVPKGKWVDVPVEVFEVYENMRRQTELAQEKQAIAEDIDNNRTEM